MNFFLQNILQICNGLRKKSLFYLIGVYVADVQDNNMLVVTSKKLDSEKTTVNHIESHLLNDQLSKFNVHTTLRVIYNKLISTNSH